MSESIHVKLPDGSNKEVPKGSTALDVAKARLGASAREVEWLCGDVRTFAFGAGRFDVNMDYCKGCGVCANECRFKAITMVREV